MDRKRVHIAFYTKEAVAEMLASQGAQPDAYEIVYELPGSQRCFAFSKAFNIEYVLNFQRVMRHIMASEAYRSLKSKYLKDNNR